MRVAALRLCNRVPSEKRGEHLGLREVVQLAQEAGGQDHGFQ